jgi:hypothetical protein
VALAPNQTRSRRFAAAWLAFAAMGCGSTPSLPVAPPAAAKPAPPPSLAPQAGYCQRLQPLLDRSTQAAGLGTALACLDVPGVTELGRYGGRNTGEEESVQNCFAKAADYAGLVEAPEGGIELAIEDSFSTGRTTEAGARLSALVPWLPALSLSQRGASELRAKVSIKDARFVTLVGLASRLQGQPREEDCLRALCNSGTSYVQKALVGTPSVVVSALDEHGLAASVDLAVAHADFNQKSLGQGRHELSSERPVTLAVARSPFRTAQTERLCQLCGRKGQSCCPEAQAPACDAGLGCSENRCVEVGDFGQPCDGGGCRGGATCVRGRCELECGKKGQPCCAGEGCGASLRCVPNPKNWLEHRAAGEDVQVDGSFFGTSEDRSIGPASCGSLIQRERFAVTKVGSGRGNCDRAWWFDPENVHDCRVGVHFAVSPFGSITCKVEVFAVAPPEPNLCTQ